MPPMCTHLKMFGREVSQFSDSPKQLRDWREGEEEGILEGHYRQDTRVSIGVSESIEKRPCVRVGETG